MQPQVSLAPNDTSPNVQNVGHSSLFTTFRPTYRIPKVLLAPPLFFLLGLDESSVLPLLLLFSSLPREQREKLRLYGTSGAPVRHYLRPHPRYSTNFLSRRTPEGLGLCVYAIVLRTSQLVDARPLRSEPRVSISPTSASTID